MTSGAPHVVCTKKDGVAVVAAVGEFDIGSSEQLAERLAHAVRQISSRVAVDLSGTAFLDSSAIGSLVGSARLAAEAGGWLRLVAPRPNVRRVLELTQIDTYLGVYDDVDSAAEASPA